MPFFSVVIPTFNRSEVLRRALDSIEHQSLEDFEVIVIDDGSTDTTKELCSDHTLKKRGLLTYRHQNNGGVSKARNLGINLARGEWVSFLDSDDEWLPEKLQIQKKLIDSHKNAAIVHGNEIWIRNNIRVNQMKKHQKFGGYIFDRCLDMCRISPSTVAIRKSVLLKEGMFRVDFPVCEDYELWLRLTSKFEILFSDSPLIKKFGGHEDQLSRKYIAMDYWRIKALVPCLDWSHITNHQKALVGKEISRKAKILLAGYLKHNNLDNISEVTDWQNQATTYL